VNGDESFGRLELLIIMAVAVVFDPEMLCLLLIDIVIWR